MGAKNQKLKTIATRKIFKENKNHIEKSFRMKTESCFMVILKNFLS